MILRMIGLGGSFIRRGFHTTQSLPEFFHAGRKGGYEIKYDRPPKPEANFFKQSLLSLKVLKQESKKWWNETKDSVRMTPDLLYRKGEVDVQHRFNGDPKCLDQWVVSCDSDYGLGYSSAKLDLTATGKGLFHGNLDTRIPKDGKLYRTGYCNMRTVPKYRSFFREIPYDWSNYNHLVMYVRGDGRTYGITLGYLADLDMGWYDIHSYFLYTRGGPYWQYVKIPFSKFVMTFKGCVQNSQAPMCPHNVNTIGITVADKVTGPFKLEISYIGVECDFSHREEFAYETYNFPRPMPG